MKKAIFTNLILLTVILFTGCGKGGDVSQSAKTQTFQAKESDLRSYVEENQDFEVIKSGKYPYEYSEYDDENATVFTFYADTKSDVLAFYKKYKSLTGKEYKKEFSGVMVVVKAGFKSDSSYTLKVKNIEKSPRYNIAHIKLKREKSLSLDAVSVPYIIINIKNTHKSTKAFIE